MILKEPKVEFVALDLKLAVETSTGTGGGQRCTGSQEDAQQCENYTDNMPW